MEETLFYNTKISKAYIRLAMPLVFSLVVTLIYNLADTFFVAQTNNTALVAGVSLAAPVFTFLMAIGNIFAQGGSSLLSRLLGQKDKEGVQRVSSFCFYASICVGIVIGIFMLIFRTQVLVMLGADAETFSHASDYYIWLAVGAPVIILSFIHANLLRSEGMSKESMFGSIGGALVNIVLDPLLISVLGMGAAGAAAATVAGYVFCDILYIVIVWKKSAVLSMNPKKIPVSGAYLIQILGIGIPAAIVNIMQSASVILMNHFLLPYGNDRIAAMGIALKASMIVLLILTGLAFGGQPLFGYFYGANDKNKLNELLHYSVRFISIIAVALTVVVFIGSSFIMKCMMDDPEIVTSGSAMLRWQVISMLFVGFILLMTIICQSLGKIAASFILSICRQGVIFVAVLFLARQIMGYNGILVSQAIADTVTAVIAGIIFFKFLKKDFTK